MYVGQMIGQLPEISVFDTGSPTGKIQLKRVDPGAALVRNLTSGGGGGGGGGIDNRMASSDNTTIYIAAGVAAVVLLGAFYWKKTRG